MSYKKHFLPLESNPELFTELIHRLGFSSAFGFHDVLSIDDPELLAFLPRPVLALVLVFPTTATYEKHLKDEEDMMEDYAKSGPQEDVIWYKQTINNACGLYGILHAVSNGDARNLTGKLMQPSQTNNDEVDYGSYITSHNNIASKTQNGLTIGCYFSSRLTPASSP